MCSDLCTDWCFCPHLAGDAAYYQGLGAGAEISGAGTMLAEYAQKVSAELSPHLWLWELTAELKRNGNLGLYVLHSQ